MHATQGGGGGGSHSSWLVSRSRGAHRTKRPPKQRALVDQFSPGGCWASSVRVWVRVCGCVRGGGAPRVPPVHIAQAWGGSGGG